MIVVSNTGPIIALSQIGRLDLLPALFGRIFIPQAVRDELIQCRAQVDAADWIEVDSISDTSTVDVLRERLDAGESEAIALAIQLNADLVLIDEARGRRVADSRGLSYIGTLGLIVEANHERVGAIWGRLFTSKQPGYGFIDEKTPELSMAIKEEYRGTGIGTILLEEFLSIAREKGYRRLSLSVDMRNRARALYQKAGFKIAGEQGTAFVMKKNL